MKFMELDLAGAYLIEVEPVEDDRGFFARSFCEREFAARGLETRFVQQSISHNTHRGTLRGVHFQREPHAETKLVRCIRGALYDLIVDLRPDSPTRHRWQAVELSARNRALLYVPQGFGHGFQTLEDDTDVLYEMSTHHEPAAAAGIHWNDESFAFQWPCPVTVISERDRNYPASSAAQVTAPRPIG